MDKRDEIILQQLDVIREMTERNMRRVGEDIWGRGQGIDINGANIGKQGAKGAQKTSGASGAPKADDAGAPKTAASTGQGNPPVNDPPPPPKENIDDLRAELDSYIGLGAESDVAVELRAQVVDVLLRRRRGIVYGRISLSRRRRGLRRARVVRFGRARRARRLLRPLCALLAYICTVYIYALSASPYIFADAAHIALRHLAYHVELLEYYLVTLVQTVKSPFFNAVLRHENYFTAYFTTKRR